jgi:ABC-type hemin transport system ATPase subunit
LPDPLNQSRSGRAGTLSSRFTARVLAGAQRRRRQRVHSVRSVSTWNLAWIDVTYWQQVQSARGSREAERSLGAALTSLLDIRPVDELPEGVGVLGGSDAVDLHGFARLLDWTGSELDFYDVGTDIADIDAAFDLAQRPTAGPAPVLIVQTEVSSVGGYTDPATLGELLFELIDKPDRVPSYRPNLEVQLCATVARGSSTLLAWYGMYAFVLAELDPAKKHAFRAQLAAPGRKALSVPSEDAPLSLVGFRLQGAALAGQPFVPVEPGVMTVLFGKNGAGKTLILNSVAAALTAINTPRYSVNRSDHLPRCDVVLRSASQDASPNLFKLVLAHMGWSPLAPASNETAREMQMRMPAWSSLDETPPDADGLTPIELADSPLDRLREVLVEAIAATSAWGDTEHTRRMLDAVMRSPAVVWTAEGSVALAVLPADLDDSLVETAYRMLDQIPMMEGKALRHPADIALLDLANTLVGRRPPAPVSLSPTPVLSIAEVGLRVSDRSDWLALGRRLHDVVRQSSPSAIPFTSAMPSSEKAEIVAEEAIIRLLEQFGREDTSEATHPFFEDPLLDPVVDALNARMNALLPSFVVDFGTLKVSVTSPAEWHRRRTRVVFQPGTGAEVDADDAPAGFRTWALAVLRFAEAQLLTAGWAADSRHYGAFVAGTNDHRVQFGGLDVHRGTAFNDAEPSSLRPQFPSSSRLVYLLDEPEAHLHLTAQHDAADVAGQLASAGQGVLVATHSLAFVDQPPGRTNFITLVSAGGVATFDTAGGLRSLTDRASELGIRPSSLAQACRGVLVVEGKNDVEILQRYGGYDLNEHFIVLAVLQGHHGATGLAELEFVHALQIPIVVMLDHVRRTVLEEALANNVGRLNAEEHTLVALHQSLVGNRLAAFVLPFAKVDIVCAVPDDEMQWAFDQLGGHEFAGWASFTERASEAFEKSGVKFKEFFERETGTTVERVIRTLVSGDRRGESRVLKEALTVLIDSLDSPEWPGLTVLRAQPKH